MLCMIEAACCDALGAYCSEIHSAISNKVIVHCRLQIMAPAWHEASLLCVARALEATQGNLASSGPAISARPELSDSVPA